MPEWIIVIIVIVCIIVLYLLSALILYLLMKRAMNKAYDALMALVPYEQERMDLIVQTKERLLDDHYHLSDEMCELVESNNALLKTPPVDVGKVKSQTDFLIMYFTKFLREKKVAKKDSSYADTSEKLLKMLHLNDDLKSSPYGKYDKLAFRFELADSHHSAGRSGSRRNGAQHERNSEIESERKIHHDGDEHSGKQRFGERYYHCPAAVTGIFQQDIRHAIL